MRLLSLLMTLLLLLAPASAQGLDASRMQGPGMSPTAASSTVYGPVQAGEAAFGPSMMQGPTMGIADSGVARGE